MKKYLWLLFLFPLFVLNVYASQVPYQWDVDGEKVNHLQSNSAGTARLEKDGKKVTLFLNNYNGGKLQLDCYGTGQSDMDFIINLEGENIINSSDVGIDMGEENDSYINFQGEGTLVITAPKPISNEDAVDVYKVNIKEETPSLISTQEDDDELLIDTKDDTTTTGSNEDDTDWLVRVLGGLLLVSIGVISFLIVKLNQKKNAN